MNPEFHRLPELSSRGIDSSLLGSPSQPLVIKLVVTLKVGGDVNEIKISMIPGPNEFVRASDSSSLWLQLGRQPLYPPEFTSISKLLVVVFLTLFPTMILLDA